MNNKRFNFLGVNISVINPATAAQAVREYPFIRSSYVCFPDASVIKEANDDATLASILNTAYLTMPDGKPSQVVGRLQGHKTVSTVSGFHLCKEMLQSNLTHYFYGGSDEIIRAVQKTIESEYPQAKVLGYKSPPFIKTSDISTNEQIQKDIQAIEALKPNLIWIGISSPKQDYLMHHYHQQLSGSLMMGVGGVFLYLADGSLKSPEWVKKIGMRWAYRLLKEPKRLGPKYYGTFKFLFQHCFYFLKLAFTKKAATT